MVCHPVLIQLGSNQRPVRWPEVYDLWYRTWKSHNELLSSYQREILQCIKHSVFKRVACYLAGLLSHSLDLWSNFWKYVNICKQNKALVPFHQHFKFLPKWRCIPSQTWPVLITLFFVLAYGIKYNSLSQRDDQNWSLGVCVHFPTPSIKNQSMLATSLISEFRKIWFPLESLSHK